MPVIARHPLQQPIRNFRRIFRQGSLEDILFSLLDKREGPAMSEALLGG
jgi:hypothetical protein